MCRYVMTLLFVVYTSISVFAEIRDQNDLLFEKVVKQGVPQESLLRVVQFLNENQGRDIVADAYYCSGLSKENEAACALNSRSPLMRSIRVEWKRYAAIIDMSLPSTEKRLFIIDLNSGVVQKEFVAHGRGSGVGAFATKFSNIESSHQTSLGLYITGGTYMGHYGPALRLYGLENTNDKAYDRDIVMHQAWYASENFLGRDGRSANSRLGLSYGCPALSPSVAQKVIGLLKGGGIIDVYYSSPSGASIN